MIASQFLEMKGHLVQKMEQLDGQRIVSSYNGVPVIWEELPLMHKMPQRTAADQDVNHEEVNDNIAQNQTGIMARLLLPPRMENPYDSWALGEVLGRDGYSNG